MPNNNQTRKIQELGQLFNGMDMSENTQIHNTYEATIQMGDVSKIFTQILGASTHAEKGVDCETVKSLAQSFGSLLEKSKDSQIEVHTSIHQNKTAKAVLDFEHKLNVMTLAKEGLKDLITIAIQAAVLKGK